MVALLRYSALVLVAVFALLTTSTASMAKFTVPPGTEGRIGLLARAQVASVRVQRERLVGTSDHSKFAPARTSSPPVTMSVSSGFDEKYRVNALVPVHVFLHNPGNSVISGSVEIPDVAAAVNLSAPQPYHTLYQAPVTLPPSGGKQVTIYMPGSDVQSDIVVDFRVGGRVVKSVNDYPTALDDTRVSIGVVTTDVSSYSWLRRIRPGGMPAEIVRLDPATLETVPQSLMSFDAIMLTHVASTSLDHAQLLALSQYVASGGSLILVGGPDWQETIQSVPSNLVPGIVTGSRTVANLNGLSSLGTGTPPASPTTASVVSRPQGAVLARQGSVPLVVQSTSGTGQILYMAFDPSVNPISGWAGGNSLLTHLIQRAAASAMSRSAIAQGLAADPSATGPPAETNLGLDLANVPSAALPPVFLFGLLAIIYVLVLGPGNLVLVRLLHRRELAWVTIPLGVLLCVGATIGFASHLKGSTLLLNTVGMVQLNSGTGTHEAALYTGLFAPVSGNYRLTYHGLGFPSYVVPPLSEQSSVDAANRIGIRFQEGPNTQMQFLSMPAWSVRDVGLHTSLPRTGAITAHLHLDAGGYIVGTIRNATGIPLTQSSVIAGQSYQRLADVPANDNVRVRLRPSANVFSKHQVSIWDELYGKLPAITFVNSNLGVAVTGGLCCARPAEQNPSLRARIRVAIADVPEASGAASAGDVLFVGWDQQALGNFTVDGVSPHRRDLIMMVAPLHVNLNHGSFVLPPRVLTPTLVDENPSPSLNACCDQGVRSVYVGPGGSATFQFNIPAASRIHWRSMALGLNAGGAGGKSFASVYDWNNSRWVPINVSGGYTAIASPGQFVSSSGAFLVRLRVSSTTGDVHIDDPGRSLQLTGTGTVS